MNVKEISSKVFSIYKDSMLKTSKYSSEETAMESIESEMYDDLLVNNFTDEEIDEILNEDKSISDKTAYKFIAYAVAREYDCQSIDEFIKACIEIDKFNFISPIDENDKTQISLALKEIYN